MTAVAPLAETDVVILAGGLGTRLGRHIGTLPKALAPVANRPFLDHQLDWLAEQGARRILLCLGHKSDQIMQHIHLRAEGDLDLIAVVEPEPRGTAGAVAYAAPSIRSDPVLVLNGDTYLDVNLAEFLARFKALNRPAALVCRQIASTARYGSVKLGADDRVLGSEKNTRGLLDQAGSMPASMHSRVPPPIVFPITVRSNAMCSRRCHLRRFGLGGSGAVSSISARRPAWTGRPPLCA